jgi:transposase
VSASKIARREAIVAMTVAGRSQAEIAAAINGGVRTVRRWQRDPEVVEAVTAAAKARQQNAVAELDKLRTKACAVLDELLDDEKPGFGCTR